MGSRHLFQTEGRVVPALEVHLFNNPDSEQVLWKKTELELGFSRGKLRRLLWI
jgi:hypothetical protein